MGVAEVRVSKLGLRGDSRPMTSLDCRGYSISMAMSRDRSSPAVVGEAPLSKPTILYAVVRARRRFLLR